MLTFIFVQYKNYPLGVRCRPKNRAANFFDGISDGISIIEKTET